MTVILASVVVGDVCGQAANEQTAEWTIGFEASEGLLPGGIVNDAISVRGAQAEVVAGGAAEGTQFLRFVPVDADNALILSIPDHGGSGYERWIRFSIRLADQAGQARLVLTGGQTIGLTPTEAGLAVDVTGVDQGRTVAPATVGSWLEMILHEDSRTGTWDLVLEGASVFIGLDFGTRVEILADLLIFADGSLDIDAVRVLTVAGVDGRETNEPPGSIADGESGGPDGGRDPQPGDASSEGDRSAHAAKRLQLLADAREIARRGDLAVMEAAIMSASEHPDGSARWHRDVAFIMSSVAFALQQEGENRLAVGVARRIEYHLEQAEEKFGADDDVQLRTSAVYLLGQVEERLLGDREQAKESFVRALTLDPENRQASERLGRIEAAESEIDRRRVAAEIGEKRP